jgi:uncharacterized protein YrzB (UPF0473 family)
MLFTYYVKDSERKQQYLDDVISNNSFNVVIYFCPKKQAGILKLPINSKIFFYEDIDKTNDPYNYISENNLLILDNCSRYKNIMTRTFKRLIKISAVYKNKLMFDITPFTTGIEYLYIPWAYMSRDVLQHQHWYAFRENNKEIDLNGNLVDGLNFTLLANKISKYCHIDYEQYFENEINIVYTKLSKNEHLEYKELRDNLFNRFNTYQPIITRLADFTNTRETRYTDLENCISGINGKTIIYTNIKSHNRELKKRFGKNVMTYYDNNGDEQQADNIILFEIPIAKNYLFLDTIANLKKDCKVYIFLADTTSDKLLYKKMSEEYTQINNFTKELRRLQDVR